MKRHPAVTRPDRIAANGDRYVLGYASTELGAKRVIAKSGRRVEHMVVRTFRGENVWEPIEKSALFVRSLRSVPAGPVELADRQRTSTCLAP